MVHKPDLELAWMADGLQYLLGELSKLDDEALGEPCALPGWTRKHVMSHLGFNARAIGRLANWARTGEVTPMYASPTSRAREIEEGARWTAPRLRAFICTEQTALAAALDALDERNWAAEVITGQGRTVAATELPWMRTRELWIHAVDLSAGGDFPDLPAGIIDRLVVEAVNKRRGGDAPSLDVRPTDRTLTILAALPEAACRVEGTTVDLARWLTRRETRGVRAANGAPLPALGPWL